MLFEFCCHENGGGILQHTFLSTYLYNKDILEYALNGMESKIPYI